MVSLFHSNRAVIAVVGAIVLIVLILAYAASTIGSGGLTNPNVFLRGQEYRNFLAGIYGLIASVEVVVVLLYYKIKSSMGLLSTEVSQPRLATAGWLFFSGALIGFVTILSISAAVYFGTITYGITGTQGNMPSISFFSAFYLLSLPGEIVLMVASFLGYTSIKRAFESH